MPVTTLKSTTKSSLSTLYSEHNSWLQCWLRAKLNCSQQAADFVQDTFVRILASDNTLNQLTKLREPRSFLATIAKRVVIDNFRRNALEKAYIESMLLLPEANEISVEQRLIILESLHELDTMLMGLGHNIKRAFLLSQLQGMPYVDIANDLDVSISSVKKYMSKATTACLIYQLESELNE